MLTPRCCRTAQVKKETRNAARDLRNDSVAIVRAQREEAAKRAVRGKKASGEIMSMLQQQVSQSDDTVFRIQRIFRPTHAFCAVALSALDAPPRQAAEYGSGKGNSRRRKGKR